MRKIIQNLQNLNERFAYLDNEKNWKLLGILYLTVLLPLAIVGFVSIILVPYYRREHNQRQKPT